MAVGQGHLGRIGVLQGDLLENMRRLFVITAGVNLVSPGNGQLRRLIAQGCFLAALQFDPANCEEFLNGLPIIPFHSQAQSGILTDVYSEVFNHLSRQCIRSG